MSLVSSDSVPGQTASTTESPAFDSKHFRSVLGHFPTGVTIVTGLHEGRPAGFTIGSFTSISLDPPLVGFFPMISSDTWAAIAPYGNFCVNVLRDTQADLCWRFAKIGVDDGRFDEVAWTPSPTTGCPVIEGVGAWIDCRVGEVVELGDHYLVVGKVVALDHHVDAPVPLVFYRGALGGFSSSN
jgi:flavin reductase (DIM6/NTAB) family NADH-FMN oxidoreductase RutF